ncbi:MAG: hypothetical protein ACKO37_07725 [Vampirovibrionales bacterium]
MRSVPLHETAMKSFPVLGGASSSGLVRQGETRVTSSNLQGFFPGQFGFFRPVDQQASLMPLLNVMPESQITASTLSSKVDAWQKRLIQSHYGDKLVQGALPPQAVVRWTHKLPGANTVWMQRLGQQGSFQEVLGFQRERMSLLKAVKHPDAWLKLAQQNLSQVPSHMREGMKSPPMFALKALHGSFTKPLAETLSTGVNPLSSLLYLGAILSLPIDSLRAGQKAKIEAQTQGASSEVQGAFSREVFLKRLGKNILCWLGAGVGFNIGQSVVCLTTLGLTWPGVLAGILLGVGVSTMLRQGLNRWMPESFSVSRYHRPVFSKAS